MHTLAATDLGQLLVWLGILLVIVVAAGFGWLWLRRRMATQEAGEHELGPLEALRQWRDRGEITDEEYQTARARIVQRVKEEAARQKARRDAGSDVPDSPPR